MDMKVKKKTQAIEASGLFLFIKEKWELQGWNQEKVAKEAGVSQSTISRIKKGDHNVTLNRLTAVCQALDIPLVLPRDLTDEYIIKAYQKLDTESRKQVLRYITRLSNISLNSVKSAK